MAKLQISMSFAASLFSAAAPAQTAQSVTPPAATDIPAGNSTDATGAVAASQPAQDGSSGQRTGLEEIVVTATRRTVDLQRVAATVEAIPANTLKKYNITGVLQLLTLVSGLVILPSGRFRPARRGGACLPTAAAP